MLGMLIKFFFHLIAFTTLTTIIKINLLIDFTKSNQGCLVLEGFIIGVLQFQDKTYYLSQDFHTFFVFGIAEMVIEFGFDSDLEQHLPKLG